MPKKAGHKELHPNKGEPLDEENEPFLRAIHKKIRNINKKVTQIADLEHKDNLKPEQVDKINRKHQILQDKEKLEKDLEMFKQVYEENRQHYRNQQLKQLQNLAQAVTVFLAFPKFEGNDKLANLWKGLTSVNGSNLNEAVVNLGATLKQVANDRKLQKSLNNFFVQHGSADIKEQSVSVVVKGETEVHTDEVITYHEETINEKGEKEEIDIVETIHDGVVEDVNVEVRTEVLVSIDQQNPAPPQNSVEVPGNQKSVKESDEKEERPKTKKHDRPHRSNWQNRENREHNNKNYERRGDGRRHYQEGENKKSYNPKYEAKPAEKVEREDIPDSDQEVKRFKKEEIEKLEEDGFIVIGKPKPKPAFSQKPRRGPKA